MVALLHWVLSAQLFDHKLLAPLLVLVLAALHLSGWSSLASYGAASLAAGFYLLIKFTIGFGALGTVLFASVLTRRLGVAGRRLAVTISGGTVGFLFGWLASGGALAGIRPYISTAYEITRGYSSAMSLVPPEWWVGVASSALWLAGIAAWAAWQGHRRILLTVAALSPPLFVAWKHGIVRQDVHVLLLVMFGLFVMALLFVETVCAAPWGWRAGTLAVLAIPLLLTGLNRYAWTDGSQLLAGAVGNPLRLPGIWNVLALGRLSAHQAELARLSQEALRPRMVPAGLRQTIGDAPVDVYPWEVSYVPANGLNWRSRPMPASYNAYTPAIDDLDAAFFEAPTRPEYILWHLDSGIESIDGRHVFWDEPRTLRTILSHYRLESWQDRVLVLRSSPVPRYGSPHVLETHEVAWHTWVPVPQGPGVQLAVVFFERSFAREFVRAVYREHPVRLTLRFASGNERSFRFLPDNGVQALWVNPFVATVDEFRTLLAGGSGQRVAAIRLEAGISRHLVPRVRLTWLEMPPSEASIHTRP